MPLIKCPECDHDASDQALACPHCGFPIKPENEGEPKPTKAPKKRGCASGAGLAVAAVILALAGWLAYDRLSEPEAPAERVEQKISDDKMRHYKAALGEEETIAAMAELNQLPRLTVPRLLRMYEANEIAADQELKGRFILLTGTVSDISKNVIGTPKITLQGAGKQKSLTAKLKKNQSEAAASLFKGNTVIIKGKVGRTMLGAVDISDGIFFDENDPLSDHKGLQNQPRKTEIKTEEDL